MKFSVFQISRKGGREKNEDRMGYCYTKSSGLFLLADGMGGHPEGEVAAQMVLQVISALYQKEATPEIADVKAFFNMAIMAAHRQILKYAAEKNLGDTPRTTLVAAIVQGGTATWVHCGDSRLYTWCATARCWRVRVTTLTWSSARACIQKHCPPISTAMCSTPAWAHPPSRCLM